MFTQSTVRVLLVCTGNICRSPMAHAYFRPRGAPAGLRGQIDVESRAISPSNVGSPPHPGTRAVLARPGVSWSEILARQIRPDDCNHFDYIVVMDRSRLRDLPAGCRPKARRLLSWTPGRAEADEIFDPYGSDRFEEVDALMQPALDKLLERIVQRHGWVSSSAKGGPASQT